MGVVGICTVVYYQLARKLERAVCHPIHATFVTSDPPHPAAGETRNHMRAYHIAGSVVPLHRTARKLGLNSVLHSTIRQIDCNICDSKSSLASNMRKHMSREHAYRGKCRTVAGEEP